MSINSLSLVRIRAVSRRACLPAGSYTEKRGGTRRTLSRWTLRVIAAFFYSQLTRTWFLLLIVFSSPELFAQEQSTDSPNWKFSAWAEVFVLPDEQDYFNPTFYARTDKLHLEARYNYEDYNTVSLWAGRRFLFGESVKFIVVPMAAVVFGNTNGLSPGLEFEIMWKKFDLYSESEHVFDFQTQDNNFFYQYGELAIRPIQPIRAGLVVQRTRLFESERELQRGVFSEYYYKNFRAGVFWFSPFVEGQYWIASVSMDF